MMSSLIEWFIPEDRIVNRTDRELASVFVFTHLFGPFLAQPMWIYLWCVSNEISWPLIVLFMATMAFLSLPFVLRHTGRVRLAAVLSFQLLAMTSLYASYHYGGFNSPFLHWLIVSLLLGLFYHSKDAAAILTLFAFDLLFFIVFAAIRTTGSRVPVEELNSLGWLSIASATIYVSWMALYYSRIVRLRSRLEEEAERSRETSLKLERARAKAEESGRNRDRFFAKVGHELRTPLNAIIGYSEILLEDLEETGRRDDARIQDRIHDVSRIKAAGKHLLSLVSRVLDSKTIERDEEILDISPVPLGEICEQVMATALPMVERNGNRFVVGCTDSEYVLLTDATRLRQVLLNLLSNAAKFTSSGTVKLELEIVEQESGDILRAAVIDTGIGISREQIGRIFENYEQAEASTVATYGGTGIGLAISQQFCRLLGGDLTVRSRPGHGSCFTAWVLARHQPAVDTGHQEAEESQSRQPNLNGSADIPNVIAYQELAS